MDVLQSVPLDRAVLCEDCKLITDSPGTECSYCGSKAIACLQTMLEKESVPESWLEALRLSSD